MVLTMAPLAVGSTMSYDNRNSNKRQRQDGPSNIFAPPDAALNEDDIDPEDELWAEYSLFALDATLFPEEAQLLQDITNGQQRQAKRPYDDDMHLSWEDFPELNNFLEGQENLTLDFQQPQQTLSAIIPELYPSLPLLENRDASLDTPNPFTDNSTEHYSFENRLSFEIPENGEINGYIKFRLRATEQTHQPKKQHQEALAVHHHHVPTVPTEKPPYIPPDFGRSMKLDATDSKILRFYLTVFCAGRTLMSKTNFWVTDLTAISDGNECAKHALLASTAAYILDYQPKNQQLRVRANAHYRRAADLLTKGLKGRDTQEIGKEEAIVTAVLFLVCDDIVNWETRKPGDYNPKWLQGTRIAKKILDNTDPGYRYWNLANVQSNSARLALANRVAFVDILTLPVSYLAVTRGDRMYGWLMEGDERELQKIFGGTGLCPKLLHTFAQITHLCALLTETPDSRVFLMGAEKITERLEKLHQWSELSEGYETAEDLLNSCMLDANGHVQTAMKVTELTAEAWRTAAQIYLQCRFFRLPRTHPEVLAKMSVLCRCLERMPCSGPLFSSQSPFFTVFLIGFVSALEEHRSVARKWFETVEAGASCRSSVPPIWKIVQDMWLWMDEEFVEQPFSDDLPLGQRDAWWEKALDRLIKTEGLLSLC